MSGAFIVTAFGLLEKMPLIQRSRERLPQHFIIAHQAPQWMGESSGFILF